MSVEGERSGAVVKNTDNADGDRLSVRLTTLQGVYPRQTPIDAVHQLSPGKWLRNVITGSCFVACYQILSHVLRC